MTTRRRLLAATGALTATSGCIGVLTGSEALERSATPARVSASGREETGYELADARSESLEREVTVAGQTRQVRAVNEISEYHRSVDLGILGEREFAVFATVATPAFEIGGQVMSPVENWSNRKIATELQSQYSDLSVGEQERTATVETLDGELTLSTFAGTATIANTADIDVYVAVGKIRHDGDFVLPVAVHPQRLSGEGERVRTLVRSLTH